MEADALAGSSSPPPPPPSDHHPDFSPVGSPDSHLPSPPLSTDDLRLRIINQVEYYFSDENLTTDKFLMKFVTRNDGFVFIFMGPHESDVKCWYGRHAVEWVSFTEKNPGRRFVRCADRVRGWRWEWLDDPVSPLVRSVMDDKLKKAERIVWILGLGLFICLLLLVFLLFSLDSLADCTCNCNFEHSGFPRLSD